MFNYQNAKNRRWELFRTMKHSGIDPDEAKSCKKHLPENFWSEILSFCLDGTRFAHKTNPCEQARVIKVEDDIRWTCLGLHVQGTRRSYGKV